LGAASEIPKTNPFLRQLFETITGTALDEEPFVGFVDDLAQLLADTDMEAVLADFGTRTVRQDPVRHFYETFLAAYDPKLREARGVYYTPEPVVSYIVRSVDYLLKTRSGCANGLADTATVEYDREDVEAASRRQKSGEVNSPLLKTGRVYINRGTGVPPVFSHGQDAHATGQYFEGVPPVFSHGQDAHATGQYFEGVPPEVWDFHIGGYQVCEKWLKDRRGRTLTYDDLEHYCKVVTALSETIRLMAEIDAAIPRWPLE
jgi:hypothetical protein